MSQSTSAPREQPVEPRKVLAFFAMVLGMFMAILDIQIVSASLAEIQAGLSASADEISWVQTSYLIAEVVMIPLSGFLGRLFSTRWLFTASAAGFTIASIFCGFSTSIEEMIFFRALQGFIGGGMIPSVFAASFSIFPPSKRPIIQPLMGLVATMAPTLGPTLGGYLTDLFSWHWLFFINVIPGVIVTIAAASLIDFDRPDFSLFERFDWWGLIFMALFLGSLEYVLEEGPTKDWFEDANIVTFTIVSAAGALLFFARTFTAAQPIVDLSAFRNRNFATGSAFSFVLGIGLYGLTYVYPVYLGRVRGYSSLQIGETLFLTGLCQFMAAPIVGRLSAKIDPRLLLAIGLTTFSAGTFAASYITKDWAFGELIIPQVFRGVGLMFSFVPINNLSLGTLSPSQMKGGAGLYNLMRNLGGAVGLALINTVLNHRIDLHLARLHEQINPANVAAQSWLDALTQKFADFADQAGPMALKQLALMVRQQATVMAFGDLFLLLTVLFMLMLPFLAFVEKPKAAAPAGGEH